MTDDLGALAKETTYRPFGEAVDFVTSLTPSETKGFIGERYDSDAGLQFLNARYYDPELHLFTQPDWFEVTQAGVGTNRYAYAGNDPINAADPGGNSWQDVKDSFSDTWDNIKDHFSGDRDTRRSAREYNRSRREGGFDGSYGDWRPVYDRVRTGTGGTPRGIRDRIAKDWMVRKYFSGNVMSGTIGINCEEGGSFCANSIAYFNKISGHYGDYKIDLKFVAAKKGVIKLVEGVGLSGGVYKRRWLGRRIIELNNGVIIDGRKRVVSATYRAVTALHELGHFLGFRHQANATNSIMSYAKHRNRSFTTSEVGRLFNAYR